MENEQQPPPDDLVEIEPEPPPVKPRRRKPPPDPRVDAAHGRIAHLDAAVERARQRLVRSFRRWLKLTAQRRAAAGRLAKLLRPGAE